jgi:putative endonuclease
MTNSLPSYYPNIGALGEELVAQYLQVTGWMILHRRWRCRWGEIDIVVRQKSGDNALPFLNPTLAFVEVKTRSQGNWDANGLLSITPQKQAKLWRTAHSFLANYPNLANDACRFDVATVYCRRLPSNQHSQLDKASLTPLIGDNSGDLSLKTIQLGQPITLAGHQLCLQNYIPSAFDSC